MCTRRPIAAVLLVLLAIVLVGGNVGGWPSSIGGFRRLVPHMCPVVIHVPDLRLQITDDSLGADNTATSGQPLALVLDIRWRSAPGGYVDFSLPEHVFRQWVDLGKIAIVAQDIVSREVHYFTVLEARSYWRPSHDLTTRAESRLGLPGQPPRSISDNNTTGPNAANESIVWLRDAAYFELEVLLDLKPGLYEIWMIYFSDPPYGAGASGHDVRSPSAHISFYPWRPWIVTQDTQRIALEIIE